MIRCGSRIRLSGHSLPLSALSGLEFLDIRKKLLLSFSVHLSRSKDDGTHGKYQDFDPENNSVIFEESTFYISQIDDLVHFISTKLRAERIESPTMPFNENLDYDFDPGNEALTPEYAPHSYPEELIRQKSLGKEGAVASMGGPSDYLWFCLLISKWIIILNHSKQVLDSHRYQCLQKRC